MLDADLLATLPTPAYVYDLDEVRRSHGLLRAALPAASELYFSLKANPHPAVVGTLRELGCRAEVCSPGELAVALEAGAEPADILYTGPGKRDQDLLDAIKAGVTWFSVDSPYGLDQLDAVAGSLGAQVRAILRVNDDSPVPGQSLTMTGVASQFGADAAWVLAEPGRFGPRAHVRPGGLHLYMGSNSDSEATLWRQFEQSIRTAHRLVEATGTELELLDLGGGFGAPFARAGVLPVFDELAGRLGTALDEAFAGWRDGSPVVAFESGRYLTATCGSLLTRVLDAKRSQGQQIVVLESGINHLGGMSGLRRVAPIVPDLLVGPGAGEPVAGTVIAGPLCTPLDSWARAATVPPLAPGDLVVVPNVGAYGLYASLVGFLGHPLPDEVVVAGGQVCQRSRIELSRRTVPTFE
ncbi:MAG TPA: type III PLP-dependent enzyme [Jatrophihabitans sp.]|nr:type III PLP-dependent enzyme [Jatrophihabitans sp.]